MSGMNWDKVRRDRAAKTGPRLATQNFTPRPPKSYLNLRRVGCPTCGAPPDAPCTLRGHGDGSGSLTMRGVHKERRAAVLRGEGRKPL